ncbi:MAG: hypothetical protein EOP43_05665, partial [Sphingobacteriaceae bacterium]
MTDVSTTDVSVQNPKTTLTVSLTTVFEICAGLIDDATWHKVVSAVIPIGVTALFFCFNLGKREINYRRGIKFYTKLIERLQESLKTCKPGDKAELNRQIKKHQEWDKIHQNILAECDKLISTAPVERIKIGRRLLDK